MTDTIHQKIQATEVNGKIRIVNAAGSPVNLSIKEAERFKTMLSFAIDDAKANCTRVY